MKITIELLKHWTKPQRTLAMLFVYSVLWMPLVAQTVDTTPKLSPEQQAKVDEVLKAFAEVQKHVQAGEIPEAIRFGQRQLDASRKAFGNDHVQTGNAHKNLGELYNLQSKHRDAERHFLELLRISELIHGSDSLQVGEVLYSLQAINRASSEYLISKGYCERCLAILEKQLGPEHFFATVALNDLAVAYWELEDYKKSLELHLKCLAIREKTLEPDHIAIGLTFVSIGRCLAKAKRFEEAIPFAERGLVNREAKFPPDSDELVAALLLSGEVFLEVKQREKADASFRRVISIEESRASTNKFELWKTLLSIGSRYSNANHNDIAEKILRKAYVIYKEGAVPPSDDVVSMLSLLAYLQLVSQQPDLKENYCREYVMLSEKLNGSNHRDTVKALAHMAAFHDMLGEHTRSKEILDRVIAILSKSTKEDLETVWKWLTTFASIHVTRSDYVAAEQNYQAVLELHRLLKNPPAEMRLFALQGLSVVSTARGDRKASDGFLRTAQEEIERDSSISGETKAEILNVQAESLREAGKFREAEPLYLKSLSLLEKSSGKNASYATTLNNLALMYSNQRFYDKAEVLFKEALAIRERELDPSDALIGNSLSTLGTQYSDQRRFKEAEPLLRRATEIREAALGTNHPKTELTRNNLAVLCEDMGELRRACELYDVCTKSAVVYVSSSLKSMSESEQRIFLWDYYQPNFVSKVARGMQHRDDADFADRSTNWIINGKALGMESLAERGIISKIGSDPQLSKVSQELGDVRKQLAATASAATSYKERQSKQETLERLTKREHALSQALSAGSGGRLRPQSRWTDWREVGKLLSSNTLLIEFCYFPEIRPGTVLFADNAPYHYGAWIIFGDNASEPVLIDLGLGAKIESEIVASLDRIHSSLVLDQESTPQGARKAHAAAMQNLTRLSDLIWKPIAKYAQGKDRLILSPDRLLWIAPWSALPIDSAGERVLIEDYTISYVNTAREIVREPTSIQGKWGVIFANPTYDMSKAEKIKSMTKVLGKVPTQTKATVLPFLPKSVFETNRPLPEFSILAEKIKPQIEKYVGEKAFVATEDAALETLAKRLFRPKALVLATHGYSMRSGDFRLATRRMLDQKNLASDGEDPLDNPLVRCGLSMAGCDGSKAIVGDDDGILTGLEIVGLDLMGTELVFLLACQSAVGDMRNGEGMSGLHHAFQLAGAKAVIGTLWPIPVAESPEICETFFDRLAEGKSKAEALRLAQLNAIKKLRQTFGVAHPCFWAAFTINGE